MSEVRKAIKELLIPVQGLARNTKLLVAAYTKTYSFAYTYRTLYLLKTGFAKKPKNPV